MNGAKNKQFLDRTDAATRGKVLDAIAKHYGITRSDALAEVTNPAAEHLLDYLVEPVRSATRVLMQKQGLSA